MKMGIAAVIMIITLILLLAFFEYYLSSTVNEIISSIEYAEESINNKNDKNAYINHKMASDNWDKNMKIYKLQINSSIINSIDEKISKLTFYIKNKNYEDYEELSYELKHKLNEILKNHKVSIENIF